MGHSLCAILIAGPYDQERARTYDLRPALSDGTRTLLPIDHYWSAAWHAKREGRDADLELPRGLPSVFPFEGAIAGIVREITGLEAPRFGLLLTDYFGGGGSQWAVVLEGPRAVTPVVSVNEALRTLGLLADPGRDEWDTFGLGDFRHNSEYLDRYQDMCDELGV